MGRRAAAPGGHARDEPFKAPLPEIAFMVEQVHRENAERDLARYTELKGQAPRSPEERAEYKTLRNGQQVLKAAEAERLWIAGLPPAERAVVERRQKAETARALAEMIQTLKDKSEREGTS